jgi:hypothetical protein
MAPQRKATASKSLRKSVTIPATLVVAVQRTAKEQQLTINRALIALAERGVRADAEARDRLQASYHQFVSEEESALKSEAGKDLIRAIFGENAIAEDSVR